MLGVDPIVAAPPNEKQLNRRLFNLAFYDNGKLAPAKGPYRSLMWSLFISSLVWESPLVKGRRVRALGTFWRTQLIRKAGKAFEADLGPDGKLICPPWSALGSLVAGTGTHEPGEKLFIDAFVRPGDSVVDVGSNIGFYAIPLALRGASVACFEPSGPTRGYLERNIALNGVESLVKVFPFALGDFDGEARFTEGLDAGNHLVLEDDRTEVPADSTTQIDVRKLVTVYEQNKDWFDRHPLVLIKIDAEGHDDEVIQGALPVIEATQPLLLIETQEGGKPIRRFLETLGYKMYWYDYEKSALMEFPQDWSGNFQFHTNFIAIPSSRLGWVTSRVAEGPRPASIVPRVRPV